MIVTCPCHWLLCESAQILRQLNVIFIFQEGMIPPGDHGVIELVALNISRIHTNYSSAQLTDITVVKVPPKISEKGNSLERLSCK